MTLSQLVQTLRDRGHSLQVMRPLQKSESHCSLSSESLVTLEGFPIPNYPEMRFGLPCLPRLVREWRKHSPDIVHVATEGPLGWSAIRAARRMNIPVVSTFHTNFHSYSKHYGAAALTPLVLAYLRWIHNLTACTMAPTQELADELTAEGFHNMEVFGRGVRLDVFNPHQRSTSLRRQWGANANDPVILHVSRLAAEKNYPLLHQAYQSILRTTPNAKLVIVGSGPLEAKLRSQFAQAIFPGPISLENRPALAQVYASADIFLYPSETETYGNVLTEAMASGNAVLAFDYAAAAMHVRNGVNGLVVPLGDNSAFIEQATALSTNSSLRQQVGIAAVKTAINFEWDPITDKVEAIFKKYATEA